MEALKRLAEMQTASGTRQTRGLSDAVLRDFLATDKRLAQAIEEGAAAQAALAREFPALAKMDEAALVEALGAGFVNFYPADQRNPYIPVAARGPWIVTYHGAVLHDSGGYGMIGFGHAPAEVLAAMARPQVMANIMTASFSQHRLNDRLRKEIGHTRGGRCPFAKFICMNSGSEAVTVAARISDINAKRQTDPGGAHAGKRLMFLSLKGSFHGRTERPAQLSDNSQKSYRANLASFRDLNVLHTVEPNDLAGLAAAFAWAKNENVWFQSMFMEPVMGEGDPGKGITAEFYKLARQLTSAADTLLVIDSIQAGIRAQGCLSICDYPGFRDLDPPDMETYSKAVNAGQFPLSILALTTKAADLYVSGVYGNTKTTNPRALDVAVTVLDGITPELRRNVVERGKELVDKFNGLAREFPDAVRKVQGTGLLVSIDVHPEAFQIVGRGHLEEYLRLNGIGVIHGGANSLRFTPHFALTSREVDLLVGALRQAFKAAPRKR
jgi:acetylornithine/succinyldiaminopimelate/putrescine aminotransferase